MSDLPQKSQFLIYQAEGGAIKIDVRFENETVWLTQQLLAELFQTTVPNVSMHLRNIFEEGELRPEATVQNFLTVRQEGTRQVSRSLDFYNLVEQYLVFAEGQALRRVPMHMRDWITKLHAFLTINDRHILTHAGKISHQMAKELAEAEYEKFNRQRIRQADASAGEFEKAVQQLPAAKPRRKKKGGAR